MKVNKPIHIVTNRSSNTTSNPGNQNPQPARSANSEQARTISGSMRITRLSSLPNITPEQWAELQARFSEIALDLSRQDHPDLDGTILPTIPNSSREVTDTSMNPNLVDEIAQRLGSMGEIFRQINDPKSITKSDKKVLEVRRVSPEQQALDNAEAAKENSNTSSRWPAKPQPYNIVD